MMNKIYCHFKLASLMFLFQKYSLKKSESLIEDKKSLLFKIIKLTYFLLNLNLILKRKRQNIIQYN